MSEPLDRDVIAGGCRGQRLGSRITVFRETESTNDIVLQAAEGGEPEGFVAFAENQTRGRGQFGRRWISAPGIGLWFSTLLRPKWVPSLLAQVTPLVAVAVARAITGMSGLDVRIKQPNDIFSGDRKLAGILSEARTGREVFVGVGIGINVNHTRTDFPPELQTTATSLAIETGAPWVREELVVAVLKALDAIYDPACPPAADVLDEYAALSRARVCDSFLA